ncbi:hypothetical protein U14_05699 [Candidatus Moduliflexus flocculans]|uniref:Uncharacterized protein n=1 Tax=Candidatus Moduliflexus flocculans TaxID=1499966 RepID=A0A081BSN3_9BACT|nr:hypothetical protein U14_05699 [Candidatus Moduliflexus flocculans]
MQKNMMKMMALWSVVLLVVVSVMPMNRAAAQDSRAIVPSPRGSVTLEAIDPATGMAKNAFCTGANAIDVRVTNNSGYAQFVSVLNRDTKGVQRTLFNGQLQTGVSYLSRLLGMQLMLSGPAGTEVIWLTTNMGQGSDNMVSYYVQDCGGTTFPPNPWPGYAQVWAQVSPNMIEQGRKGTITVQTSVGAQMGAVYYLEILNSWGQLWKRIPVTKAPYDYYQVTLPVGTKTKPGMLTYTVHVAMESGFGGQAQRIGTTQFAFQVVRPGMMAPYNPEYQGQMMPPAWTSYGMNPSTGTASDGAVFSHPSFVVQPYSPYGLDSMNGAKERSIE